MARRVAGMMDWMRMFMFAAWEYCRGGTRAELSKLAHFSSPVTSSLFKRLPRDQEFRILGLTRVVLLIFNTTRVKFPALALDDALY